MSSGKEKEVRDITDLPGVGPTTAQKLIEAGYTTIEAIAVATPHEISQITGIPLLTAQKIVEAAREALNIDFKTAYDLKIESMSVKKITTSSRNLDELLGGGVETKTITEFFGEFGSGKCVTGDTPVLHLVGSGLRLTPIEDLYRSFAEAYGEQPHDEGYIVKARGLKVLAFDSSGLRVSEAAYLYRERARSLIEIRLSSGARVKATPRHPLLVLSGSGVVWKSAGLIRPGDYVALALRTMPQLTKPSFDPNKLYKIGAFLSRGEECIKESHVKASEGAEAVDGSSVSLVYESNPDGCVSIEDFVTQLLSLDRASIAAFLAGFFEGRDSGVEGEWIEIALEGRVARTFGYLLARIGVKPVIEWRSGGAAIIRVRRSDVDAIKSGKTGDDFRVPSAIISYIAESLKNLKHSRRDVERILEELSVSEGWVSTSSLRRAALSLAGIADALRQQASSSDNYGLVEEAVLIDDLIFTIGLALRLDWDMVVETRIVEYDGYVYDVVVPHYHSFVAGDLPIVMHNTQICHQLAVNVQLPEDKGGLAGRAVYIDTEGTFRWERIEQMARGVGLDPDDVMKNIYWIRAINSHHQIAIVDKLFGVVKNEDIKLVVVDSVTSHFRAEYPGRENLAMRQQLLNRHLHQLMRIADIFNIAVVITNQVMARPDVFYGDPTQAVGGHVVGHAPGVRVYLKKSRGNKRIARVVDAPHLPEGETVFVITEWGIRDPE